MALHNTVVQEVAGARVGEGGALELHRVHLVDEAVRTGGDMVSPGVLQCRCTHFTPWEHEVMFTPEIWHGLMDFVSHMVICLI